MSRGERGLPSRASLATPLPVGRGALLFFPFRAAANRASDQSPIRSFADQIAGSQPGMSSSHILGRCSDHAPPEGVRVPSQRFVSACSSGEIVTREPCRSGQRVRKRWRLLETTNSHYRVY